MRLALGFVTIKLLALLAVVAVTPGCYAGRDCKPGDACWQNCATNPDGPGCVQPWEPIPIEAKHDAGADR